MTKPTPGPTRGPTRDATDRRGVLAGGAAALVGALALNEAAAQTAPAPGPDYAIFTEFSPDTKPMRPGWNTRVFTDTDARRGGSIACDFTTGVITLAPGIYHINGMSIATYFSDQEPPEMSTVRAPASAGYCRLRTYDPKVGMPADLRQIANDGPGIICIGSTATANLTPSLFEAFYEAERPTQIILEHQSGSKPERIYLRVFVENSKWHALARISIRRI